MTEKEKTPDQESKDKDYGFPFVDVQPIQGKRQEDIPTTVSQVSAEASSKEVLDKEKGAVLEQEAALPEAETISIPEQRIEAAGIQHKAKEKKSSMPMVISLLFLIVLILAAMAYFLYLEPGKTEETLADKKEEVQKEEAQEYGNVWESEEAEVQEQSSPEEVVVPSGGLLTVINSRASSPRYFVVISSLPSEESARKIAQHYLDKGVSLWMVFPFGENTNYRLAVGQFDDIETASKAVEEAKPTYGESIWILKY